MSKRNQITHSTCPKCGGKGTIILAPDLQQTLGIFQSRSRFTSSDVLRLSQSKGQVPEGTTTNAMNNRLERLRKQGLLERVREGRFFRYFKVKPKPCDAPPEGQPATT